MNKLIPVMGYLANNWPGLNSHTPAVVMNPQAQPLDLLAWCWGEFLSVQSAANVLLGTSNEIRNGDFSALIVHRLDALSEVFEIAVSRLIEEKTQAASGAIEPMPGAGIGRPVCAEVTASGRA